ncbi:hypothetical protein D3C75_912870 [compost metagenome]
MLRVPLVHLDLGALSLVRPQILRFAPRVVGDHLVGGIQNCGGRAVVLLQENGGGFRIIPLEVQDIGNIRPPPAVDGLVAVAHHADAVVLVGNHFAEHILGPVGVLILVHMDVLELVLVIIQHLGHLFEELNGHHDQIVKVQRVVGL